MVLDGALELNNIDDDGGGREVSVAAATIHATSVPVTFCIFSNLISEQQTPA